MYIKNKHIIIYLEDIVF